MESADTHHNTLSAQWVSARLPPLPPPMQQPDSPLLKATWRCLGYGGGSKSRSVEESTSTTPPTEIRNAPIGVEVHSDTRWQTNGTPVGLGPLASMHQATSRSTSALDSMCAIAKLLESRSGALRAPGVASRRDRRRVCQRAFPRLQERSKDPQAGGSKGNGVAIARHVDVQGLC